MPTKTKKNKNKTKKSKTRRHRVKKEQCGPGSDSNSKTTCISDKSLDILKNIWNERNPDDQIHSNTQTTVRNHILKKTMCNTESCWVNNLIQTTTHSQSNVLLTDMRNKLVNSFAPKAPTSWKKNPNKWLSNIDITNVMKQYEYKYKCFDFIGPSPIDYDHIINGICVWGELCNFDLSHHINNGRSKIGIIFNLDDHKNDGSHWVSLFINVQKQTIFYFDSVGDKIPQQIMKFVNTVMEQGLLLSPKINFKFDQNYPIEHQYGNTECGMYSLFFIIQMLQDKITARYLKTHIIPDKFVQKN